MTTIAEWYGRVNDAWPKDLPTLTAHEAERATKRLYRFAMGHALRYPTKITGGHNYSYGHGGYYWVNPERGWHNLVHDISHHCHTRLSKEKPHSRAHARLELRLIKEVVKRGWLDGKLKPAAKADKPEPGKDEVRAAKVERLEARRVLWERKMKRAETAIKKIDRQLRGHARWAA